MNPDYSALDETPKSRRDAVPTGSNGFSNHARWRSNDVCVDRGDAVMPGFEELSTFAH